MTPPFSYISVIISPSNRAWPFIWTSLNSLQRIICTKFDWFWPAGSGEEDFKKNFCVFLLFRYYFPLERCYPLFLKNTWILSLQGWFVPSLVKIGPVVQEKKIFKWPHPIFTFLWLSPPWRGCGPLFEQTWIPFTKR
jgi:hypothetical protein